MRSCWIVKKATVSWLCISSIAQAQSAATTKPSITQQLSKPLASGAAEAKTPIHEENSTGVKVNILGGAWLTRKAGNSDPLRGLEILALRSKCRSPDANQCVAILRERLGTSQDSLKEDTEKLATETKQLADDNKSLAKARESLANSAGTNGGFEESLVATAGFDERNVEMQKQIVASEANVVSLRGSAVSSLQILLDSALKWKEADPVGLANIYTCFCGTDQATTWGRICTQQLAESAHTDIDGKYKIQLVAGKYMLFAKFESAYSTVVWLIPVTVDGSKDISLDLHNENAFIIANSTQWRGEAHE